MAHPINPIDGFELNGVSYKLADNNLINRSELGVLGQAAAIGDTTYATDPTVSSWVMADFTGGIGIEDITGADTTRYRWGTADARGPGGITLGPLVTQTRPTANDAHDLYLLGDIPGTNEEFYVAVKESAGLTNIYAWNETTDTWRTASADINSEPYYLVPSVRFQGTNANKKLYIGTVTDGPKSIVTTGAGVVTVAVPGAGLGYAVWDNRIWTINALNELKYSFDGITFTAITNPTTGANLALELGQVPYQLFSWYNLAGESTLYVITVTSLWAYNGGRGAFEHIYDIPPHPDVYRPATVWRPTEDLWIGVGGSIIRRTPAGVTVPLAGPGSDGDGLPSGFIGSIWGLTPEFNALYCSTIPKSGQSAVVLAYSGTGWHPIWEASAGTDTILSPYVSQASGAYRLWWAILGESYAYTTDLRTAPYSPRQGHHAGIDKFAASSYLETGRFWAQTWGLPKQALALEVFMENATSTETLTVQYQTDTVTAWTTLGDPIETGRNNGTYLTRIEFGTPDSDGVYPGISFNWIKFKFIFARGSTITETPIMNAAVLHFIKGRDNTPGFQLAVDLSGNLDGRTPDAQRDELRALLESGGIYSLKYGIDRVLGVIVTGMSSAEASGADTRGVVTLSLLAVQVVQ